ncbi:VOC family protein [Henriciella aquimarina]|uniref:VOC family protein n=1 Tax=Henriciella aquimarina TaxID=545261 RepID=UPI001301B199|nr:VOC family protein [Henriciella aquimarina]
MVTTDLTLARKFYEEFLGFECVRYAPDRLLLRDKTSANLMKQGKRGGFVIDVREVEEVLHPQHLFNHWGLTVDSAEEVDRIREIALSDGETYGLTQVNKISKMHNSYQFYFSDLDENWWEIEYRNNGITNEMVFENGDFKRKKKPAETGEEA